MKHQHDDLQLRLFAEPHKVVDSPPPRQSPFEPALLEIMEHEGEPHITTTSACNAMHYGEVIHLREFIKRLDKVEQWGLLSYCTMPIRSGKGRIQIIDEPLLTEKQFTIVCMRSNQPNMAVVRSLIADVFIAWRRGRLRAADAQTEVQLQEATDRAIDEMPTFFAWAQEIVETGKAARAAKRAAEQAARAAVEIATNQRRYPLDDTVRISTWIINHNYRDYCPCCERTKICPNTAGTHWAHMKGKYRREVLDGWFVCETCNRAYENSKNTQEIYIAFIAYVRHVEAYLAQGHLF